MELLTKKEVTIEEFNKAFKDAPVIHYKGGAYTIKSIRLCQHSKVFIEDVNDIVNWVVIYESDKTKELFCQCIDRFFEYVDPLGSNPTRRFRPTRWDFYAMMIINYIDKFYK